MQDAIEGTNQQFLFKPEIVYGDQWHCTQPVVLAGMGGSALPGDAWNIWQVDQPILLHNDYGLPPIKSGSIIAASYSGDTEETLDAFESARAQQLPLLVITAGGELLRRAQEFKIPHIIIPDTGIQPRMSTGFFLAALAKAMGSQSVQEELQGLSPVLDPKRFSEEGTRIAALLEGKIPLVYASRRNYAVARIWKIKLNETGKVPAFWNVLPELNHNEMTGFGGTFDAKNIRVVLLRDDQDHPRIRRRMDVLKDVLKEQDVECIETNFMGSERIERIVNMFLVGDWVSLALANRAGVDPEQVPMVQTFKKALGT